MALVTCYEKSKKSKEEVYKIIWDETISAISGLFNYDEFINGFGYNYNMNVLKSCYMDLESSIKGELRKIGDFLILGTTIYEDTYYNGNELIKIKSSNEKILHSLQQTTEFIKTVPDCMYNVELINEFWQKYPDGLLMVW